VASSAVSVAGMPKKWFIRVLRGSSHVVSAVIVIGGLKSRGLTKSYVMCTEKISPVEIPTIPGLSLLRDDQ
jgi:hypothetical protein